MKTAGTNVLKQDKAGNWEVHCADGTKFAVKPWDEKKKDAQGNEVVYKQLVFPKNNVTGRGFMRRPEDGTEVPFENKTTGPRVLGSKLTEEAAKRVADLHAQILAIKNDPKNQVAPTKIDVNSEEGIMAAMQKFYSKLSPEAQAKLQAELKGKKAGK